MIPYDHILFDPEVFDLVDVNGDGVIVEQEFLNALEANLVLSPSFPSTSSQPLPPNVSPSLH